MLRDWTENMCNDFITSLVQWAFPEVLDPCLEINISEFQIDLHRGPAQSQDFCLSARLFNLLFVPAGAVKRSNRHCKC